MKRQMQGVLILLGSILLLLGFAASDWEYIWHTDLEWSWVWMLTGIFGLAWGFLPPKEK